MPKHEPVQNGARKYTNESRLARRERLTAAGQWENFNRRRYELQNEGYEQKVASRMADEEFRHFGVAEPSGATEQADA